LEMNSELLCKLFTTIGKFIDIPEAKQYMESYFTRIDTNSQDQIFSARIRFMFQDLLELRLCNWVPRHAENTPKTISEVHADAIAKEYEDSLPNVPTIPRAFQQSTKVTSSTIPEPTKASKKTHNQPDKQKNDKPKPKKKLNAAELEQRITLILQEYLRSQDLADSAQSLKDLNAPHYYHKVIELGVNITLERSSEERELMFKLFSNLFKVSLLTADHFLKGFKQIVESIEDLEIDIPFACKYVARFLGLSVVEKCITQQQLAEQPWFSKEEKRLKQPFEEVIGNPGSRTV